MLNKLFIINNKNKYYQLINGLYKNSQKAQPLTTFYNSGDPIDLDYKNIDVIITNTNLSYNILKNINKKKIIIFLIQKFNFKHKDLIDKQIDPFLSKDIFKQLQPKYDTLIKSDDYKNDDFFDIIRILEWDSNFWNKKTSFVSCLFLNNKIMKKINIFNKKNNVKICTYLCNCHDRQSVLIAEKNGFHFTDIKVTLDLDIDKLNFYNISQKSFRLKKATKSDIPKLRNISKNIYIHSRYYFDRKYSINKISKFYMNWVEKSVKSSFDDYCLCLYHKKQVIAFSTIKIYNSKKSSISLFGVDKNYMNKNIGSLMLQNTIFYLKKEKIKNIEVVTQGRNIVAQKLYQKNGFKTKKTELWYHKWLK